MTSRLERVQIILQKHRLDGLLVSRQSNITYLTGFSSSDSYLLVGSKETCFITDSRYYQQARRQLGGAHIRQGGRSVFNTIVNLAKDARIKRLGFEAKNLDVYQYTRIKKLLGSIDFIATQGLVEQFRKIKEPEELVKIKRSVNISVQALRYAQRIIRPGLSEIEVAGELARFIRYKGAQGTSFATIVASGENSAFPHHLTSEKKLKKGECVLVDLGVEYQGYKSDLTRTLFLGRIPSKFNKIYKIVRIARARAIKRIKPGVRGCEIDKFARQHIIKHGYGGFFAHNLGHGIGLDIHEGPYLSTGNKATLKPGMVFTVEPAIYLPGEFGVRIEDDVAVTKDGCEVLSGNLDK